MVLIISDSGDPPVSKSATASASSTAASAVDAASVSLASALLRKCTMTASREPGAWA
jgi:hypothetical protein